MASFLNFLSSAFGWIYFFCWGLSFYPQAILNWRRRSTSGTTVDFPFINCLGFAAYFASNSAFYYSPVIRSQYAARHHGLASTVQFNDVTFALHGLILSLITASQYLLGRSLWRFHPSLGTRPTRPILGIGVGCLVGVAGTALIVLAASPSGSAADPGLAMTFDPARDWCALDIVYAVSYVKIVVTLVKYTPQVLANRRNRSTRGWSIWQILLDFSGGILSVAQQAIDSYIQGDWSGITGNPVKFALGNVSMVYDVVFMVQHYVLYRGAGKEESEAESEEERLLPRDEEGRVG